MKKYNYITLLSDKAKTDFIEWAALKFDYSAALFKEDLIESMIVAWFNTVGIDIVVSTNTCCVGAAHYSPSYRVSVDAITQGNQMYNLSK